VTVYDGDNCTATSAAMTVACQDISQITDNNSFSYQTAPGVAMGGTCTQATPMGSVNPSGDTSICCGQPGP
jgi:hypothetical protein